MGCDYPCTTPEWDLRDQAPAWWPCVEGAGIPLLSITDDPAPLTAGSDPLFTLHYDAGDTTYPLGELKLWVEEDPTHVTSLTIPLFLSHDDADADGTFSQGDSLFAQEPAGLSLYDAAREGAVVNVELLIANTRIAAATWSP